MPWTKVGCDAGWERPHVTVTMGWKRSRPAAWCPSHFGGRIGPGEVRRLCCDARSPDRAGARSEPLMWAGSSGVRRCRSAGDRVRDGGLPSECDGRRVGAKCITSFTGSTVVNKSRQSVMLCWTHHRMMHRSGWIVRIRDGLAEFIPPKWIDYFQTPAESLARSNTRESGIMSGESRICQRDPYWLVSSGKS